MRRARSTPSAWKRSRPPKPIWNPPAQACWNCPAIWGNRQLQQPNRRQIVNLPRRSVKLFLASLTAVVAVNAQDFYWNTASARSMALGGVYLPSAEGALDALAANPAGLTELNARTVDLSVTSIFARGSFSNSVNN